jgi:hypothetical protein
MVFLAQITRVTRLFALFWTMINHAFVRYGHKLGTFFQENALFLMATSIDCSFLDILKNRQRRGAVKGNEAVKKVIDLAPLQMVRSTQTDLLRQIWPAPTN